jgi:toxin ParE1/3/4
MEVVYHPLVQRDVEEVLSYYRQVSSRLADEFHEELRSVINQAADNPLKFPPVDQNFRRANLKRFPYHILYDVSPDRLRVMLVRHHKRHPRYGLSRKL